MNEKITISGAEASEQIVKKLIGEVPEFLDADLREVETFARFIGCDIALELLVEPKYKPNADSIDPFSVICAWGPVPAVKGKLWLWSIKVIRDRKTKLPMEDKGTYSSLSSPVIGICGVRA